MNVHGPVVMSPSNAWSMTRKERTEMLYLTTHSTHFIYGYMVSDGSSLTKTFLKPIYLSIKMC